MNELQRLTSITGEIDTLYHEASYRLGQSDSSMTTLYTLLSCGGKCDISEICRLSGLRKQTLNSALRKMEENGLITLEKKDSKNKTVLLTDNGRDEAEHTAGKLMEIENSVLGRFTAEEIQNYLSLSERFLEHFRELVNALPERTAQNDA